MLKAPLWRADDGLPPTPPAPLLLNVLCRKPLALLLLLLVIAIVLRTLRAKFLRSGLSDGRLAAMMATLTSMAVTMGRTTHVLCVEFWLVIHVINDVSCSLFVGAELTMGPGCVSQT